MMNNIYKITDKLEKEHSLSINEYEYLITEYSLKAAEYISPKALKAKREIYADDIYVRGLIEISNICKNDCLYCGIRASNTNCDRYRLNKADILSCCDEGYGLGLRTFVMQGGEDMYFDDDTMCDIIKSIKSKYPDCAVTLSLGEKSRESYQKMYDAGADRYLLRHETADREHYSKLHPQAMSYDGRMECLRALKEIGYQTGCGFMVGSPYQTVKELAQDLKFIEEFKPDMCGVGPFIPHNDTRFRDYPAGSVELTCYLLAIIRLIHPRVLLPATTALATLSPGGRQKAVLSGANVVMPNLSPTAVRDKYLLYNNKASRGTESAQCIKELKEQMADIGAVVVTHRGDVIK